MGWEQGGRGVQKRFQKHQKQRQKDEKDKNNGHLQQMFIQVTTFQDESRER